MSNKRLLFAVLSIFLIEITSAHCPLCTAGAGAAAAGAVWFGVNKTVVALFIGAFAMSMGMWFARVNEKKRLVPFQKTLIIGGIFLITVLPILPMITYVKPFYISLTGAYGGFLNRTYMLNYSLVSSLFGGLIVFVSPILNKKIKEKMKKGIPFQGILLTFFLLAVAALVIQFLL